MIIFARMMNKLWLLPLVLVLAVILLFVGVINGIPVLPYYLFFGIPYLALGNVLLIAYIAVKHRNQLWKVLLMSVFSLGLAYLVSIQTA